MSDRARLDEVVRAVARDIFAPLVQDLRDQLKVVLEENRKRPARADTDGKWLTIPKVAKAVGRTPKTVRRWIASGKLRTTGEDGRYVAREELERFMSQPREKDDDDQDVERVVARLLRKK